MVLKNQLRHFLSYFQDFGFLVIVIVLTLESIYTKVLLSSAFFLLFFLLNDWIGKYFVARGDLKKMWNGNTPYFKPIYAVLLLLVIFVQIVAYKLGR